MAAEAAVSFAVGKLGELAIEKVKHLSGVEKQVNRLRNELLTMQSFLRDAAEKQTNNNLMRQWISDIRDVAQDAEDAIETFVLNVENPRKSDAQLKRCFCFPNHLSQLDKVKEQIESIQTRLDNIEKNRVTYGIQNLGEAETSSSRIRPFNKLRVSRPYGTDKDVVGLEDDINLLIREAVFNDRDGLFVTTIAGMGGLGKSTLAKKVYNHTVVLANFNSRAWVCVSDEFNPQNIIEELVAQLTGPGEDEKKALESVKNLPLERQVLSLRQRLQGKQYFIVLDDVWQQDAWSFLKDAFPDEEGSRSRLLLTSRNRDVALEARYVHDLKLLDWDKSWQLFLNKAFVENADRKCPNKDLEDVGKEILNKCGGLPLAIVVVGGLLVTQRGSTSGWKKVLKGIKYHLGSKESSVSAVLEMSYHNLPPKLKSCFLCLAFFKEDAIIRARKLVRVWIAEGLVMEEENGGEETLEDIAKRYLDELTNRNLVQVRDTNTFDLVKSCSIHDLVRELSIRKAKEEIGFEIIREGNSQYSRNSRHRVIYTSDSYSGSSSKHIRSLFFHGGRDFKVPPSCWKNSRLLRVLDMENCSLRNLPDAIGALIGLRYLSLRNSEITKLPSSFRCLKNLQVLDIKTRLGVALPDAIWKMDNLRHLYMNPSHKVPSKIVTLKNIQTLVYIFVGDEAPEYLTQMTRLRKLGLELGHSADRRKLITLLASLDNLACLDIILGLDDLPLDWLHALEHLTYLKLRGNWAPPRTLPNLSYFPPNLSHLVIVEGRSYGADKISILGKLTNLVYLKFDHAEFDEQTMVISDDGFPRLEVLSFNWRTYVANIKIGKGALIELKRLELLRYSSLNLPEDLKLITGLQELKIGTTRDFAPKILDENFHIISHIPFVEVGINRMWS